MRLDALKLAMKFYEKTGQHDKVRSFGAFVEGISSTILVPGTGLVIEKPIEVLFVDEEYMVLGERKLRYKKQTLVERDGHQFDVVTTTGADGNAGDTLYFNIDLPYKSLGKSVDKLLDDKVLADPDK
jgi:hypothetical protein